MLQLSEKEKLVALAMWEAGIPAFMCLGCEQRFEVHTIGIDTVATLGGKGISPEQKKSLAEKLEELGINRETVETIFKKSLPWDRCIFGYEFAQLVAKHVPSNSA